VRKAALEDRFLGAAEERGRLGWLDLLEREEKRGAPFSVGTARWARNTTP
jgi:hypothetical protein